MLIGNLVQSSTRNGRMSRDVLAPTICVQWSSCSSHSVLLFLSGAGFQMKNVVCSHCQRAAWPVIEEAVRVFIPCSSLRCRARVDRCEQSVLRLHICNIIGAMCPPIS